MLGGSCAFLLNLQGCSWSRAPLTEPGVPCARFCDAQGCGGPSADLRRRQTTSFDWVSVNHQSATLFAIGKVMLCAVQKWAINKLKWHLQGGSSPPTAACTHESLAGRAIWQRRQRPNRFRCRLRRWHESPEGRRLRWSSWHASERGGYYRSRPTACKSLRSGLPDRGRNLNALTGWSQ